MRWGLVVVRGVLDKAETAEGPPGSFAIITTEAGEDSRAIHNRQPVIFREGRLRRWLDLSADVTGLLAPSPPGMVSVERACLAVAGSSHEASER